MEIKETLVITFLIVIIIILIFSKISVSLSGSDSGYNNNIYASQNRNQNQLVNMMSSPTPAYNVNDLISNDVKKQLNTLNNQFYVNPNQSLY